MSLRKHREQVHYDLGQRDTLARLCAGRPLCAFHNIEKAAKAASTVEEGTAMLLNRATFVLLVKSSNLLLGQGKARDLAKVQRPFRMPLCTV